MIAALFAATWVLASISTDRQRQVPRPRTFVVGAVDDVAASIDERGPILYPDLRDATGERSIVIDHTGGDPARGWQLYSAFPAGRDWTCPVEQVEVGHAGRAGGLAAPAAEAGVEVGVAAGGRGELA